MKCYLSKYTGFCFGVSLSVKAAYENINIPLYMYGDVVNNPVVISDLLAKGIKITNNIAELRIPCNEKVLIRAHGVPEKVIQYLEENKIAVIDKTCPKVKKVHNIVREASNRGLDIIVVGNPNHPETIGTTGWSRTKTIIIEDMKSAEEIIPSTAFSSSGVCMVAQTTHNLKIYEEIYNYCSIVLPNIEYHNTICDDTANRQREIRELAQQVDSVIIIGGKASSNSTKLFEIASEYCCRTQHVESETEIDFSMLDSISSLAISSGSSTPDKSISTLIQTIKTFCTKQGMEFELINLKDTSPKNI